jgi:hypothetical protein
MAKFWKEDWERARKNLLRWWRLEGPAISVMAPKDEPWAELPAPERELPFCQPNGPKAPRPAVGAPTFPVPDDPLAMWTDPEVRFRAAEHQMAHTFYGGEAFPYFDPHLGPGNDAAFLGAEPSFSETDAWFTARMPDLTSGPPLRFDERDPWFRTQMALIEHGVRRADGRFLVSFPDLFENLDVLAALRGTSEILTDMALEPEAVVRRAAEVNAVFFEAFDRIAALIRDEHGGNSVSTFDVWGPGRTIKTQVDLGAMFSPAMFESLALPGLVEVCRRFDFVLYHLDGSQCLGHLDHILGVEGVTAIEWTPEPGRPGGGDPTWYDLYRRIKAAGKAVQAIWITPDEIDPLFEAVGPEGMFLQIRVPTESDARRLLDRCAKWYR